MEAEKYHEKPWFQANEKAHGHDGQVATAPHDPAPISSQVLLSYQSHGLPYSPDMFTTGESSHGCGHVVRTIYQGIRSTAADYLKERSGRNNLDIKTDVYVDKVILRDTSNGIRAVGVDLRESTGRKTSVVTRQEVILTAGVYGSPAIMLRSGIGDRLDVEQHGIKSLVHLPGVGKNLMDHLVSQTPYKPPAPQVYILPSCVCFFFAISFTRNIDLIRMSRSHCHFTKWQSRSSQMTI